MKKKIYIKAYKESKESPAFFIELKDLDKVGKETVMKLALVLLKTIKAQVATKPLKTWIWDAKEIKALNTVIAAIKDCA